MWASFRINSTLVSNLSSDFCQESQEAYFPKMSTETFKKVNETGPIFLCVHQSALISHTLNLPLMNRDPGEDAADSEHQSKQPLDFQTSVHFVRSEEGYRTLGSVLRCSITLSLQLERWTFIWPVLVVLTKLKQWGLQAQCAVCNLLGSSWANTNQQQRGAD